jgi:hypothetical protein
VRAFDPSHREVHYPADRRFRVRVGRAELSIIILLALVPLALAWIQFVHAGLPQVPAGFSQASPDQPYGFPRWLCLTHFVNFFFLMLLARSGLSILMDHPRLYWNRHCTPGTEWIKFTPIDVPIGRVWTAKEDARYISPLFALPGYRHTVGMARAWHFFSLCVFLMNGFVFVLLLCCTSQWKRLVPTSWEIVPGAWNVLVHYATLHLPPEPNGFNRYNALQQHS